MEKLNKKVWLKSVNVLKSVMSNKAKKEIERRIKQIARESKALDEALTGRSDWDFMVPNVLRIIEDSIHVIKDITPAWSWTSRF